MISLPEGVQQHNSLPLSETSEHTRLQGVVFQLSAELVAGILL